MKNINNRTPLSLFSDNVSVALLSEKAVAPEKVNKRTMDSNIIKTNFLNYISHELRTPLNSINGAIHYLQHSERPVARQDKEFYEIISSETGSLVNIVENLLDFLRSEENAKKTVIQIFLEFIAEFLNLGICSVMLNNGRTGELAIAGAIGLDKDVIRNTRIRIGDPIAGWVALKGEPLLIKNIEKDPFFKRDNISQYNTKSLLSMPLKVKNRVIGVINMNNKRTAASFTARDLRMASILSDRISQVVETLYGRDYT